MSGDKDLESWLRPLQISSASLETLTRHLAVTYRHLALHSEDQFLATPVTKLPTGEERGEFLCIDLGGSNLRVAFVNLLGPTRVAGRRFSLNAYDERIEKYNQMAWPIGASLKDEHAGDLFAWLGDCLAEVIAERFAGTLPEALPEEIPLGITFSFPMMQSTLSKATLLPMGKGFSITGNPDLAGLVRAGYERHTKPRYDAEKKLQRALPKIKLIAIANDSVSTLISLAYTTVATPGSKAAVGLILGTGTNAAIAMKPAALHPDKVEYATRGDDVEEIVVNTEWTIKGVGPTLKDAGIFTPWDMALDAAISTPGFQPFEYMTAGSYLGEIVRLAVLDYFVTKLGLREEDLPGTLRKRNALTTSYLGWNVAVTDDTHALATSLDGSAELGTENTPNFQWTPELANVLMQTERAVLRRSTNLISAAIIALLISNGELTPNKDRGRSTAPPSAEADPSAGTTASRELVVAYCGGLICIYEGYLARIRTDIDALLQSVIAVTGTRIVLREASEGGVIGAGVLAGTVWPAQDSEMKG